MTASKLMWVNVGWWVWYAMLGADYLVGIQEQTYCRPDPHTHVVWGSRVLGMPKHRHWKVETGNSFVRRTVRSQGDPERFLFPCTTAIGDWYRMLIHLRNSNSNLAVSNTTIRNRWSTQLNALDWSKLISVAPLSSSIVSMISRTKCRLFWIDLLFTIYFCLVPIWSPATICKWFAKTQAKIVNSVFSRVMLLPYMSATFLHQCDQIVSDMSRDGSLSKPMVEHICQNRYKHL